MNAPELTPPAEPGRSNENRGIPPAAVERNETGNTTEQGSELDQLNQQLQQTISERDANLERWQRSLADFDNFRKRIQREQEQERQYRSLGVVRDLLPALDNLQRALQAAKGTRDLDHLDQLLQGVQMVAQQFTDALGRHSVLPIQAEGQPFDPNLHEAIQQMPSADHPPMTVLQEVERGYMLHDRVVRPTKVIVSTSPPEAEK